MTTSAPGIRHIDEPITSGPIQGDDSSIPAFLGKAEWGPLSSPVLLQSFGEYLVKFGGYLDNSDLTYAVEGFFNNGGRECYVVRTASYTDVDTGATLAAAATLAANDQSLTDVVDEDTGQDGDTVAVTFNFTLVNTPIIPGTVVLSITGVADATDDGSGALTGTNVTSGAIDYDTGVGSVTYDTAPAVDDLLSDYSYYLEDKIFDVDAKYPGTYGNDLEVAIVSNPLHTSTVAAAEVAGTTTFTVSNKTGIVEGQVLQISPTGGDVEYAKVVTVETAVVAGVPVHTVTVNGALTSALTLADAVSSLEFDLEVYFEDSVNPVETWPAMSLETGALNNLEDTINNEDTGSTYVSVEIDATNTVLLAGLPTVEDTYYPQAFSRTSLAGGVTEGTVTATDLIGSSVSGVGLHALDSFEDVRLIAYIPDSDQAAYEAGPIHEAHIMADSRSNLFILSEVDPDDSSATAAITNRNSDGFSSSSGSLYVGRIKIFDPLTNGTRYVSPLGHVAGRMGTVDRRDNGGPWDAPAGRNDNGVLVGALDVESKYSRQQRSDLNEAGINVIRRLNNVVYIFGARTLSDVLEERYINTVRSLKFFKSSLDDGLEGDLFKNNDSELWDLLRNKIGDFLNTQWQLGGLRGNTPAAAYVVEVGEDDGVQTPADTLAGRVVSRIQVALQRPGEFFIFYWSQITNV